MSGDLSIPEYDVMVFRAEQQRQEVESTRKHQRAINRWRYGSYAVSSIAGAAAVLGVAWIIWQGTAGPSAKDESEERIRIECIDSGGTWLKVDTSSAGPQGTCIFGKESE